MARGEESLKGFQFLFLLLTVFCCFSNPGLSDEGSEETEAPALPCEIQISGQLSRNNPPLWRAWIYARKHEPTLSRVEITLRLFEPARIRPLPTRPGYPYTFTTFADFAATLRPVGRDSLSRHWSEEVWTRGRKDEMRNLEIAIELASLQPETMDEFLEALQTLVASGKYRFKSAPDHAKILKRFIDGTLLRLLTAKKLDLPTSAGRALQYVEFVRNAELKPEADPTYLEGHFITVEKLLGYAVWCFFHLAPQQPETATRLLMQLTNGRGLQYAIPPFSLWKTTDYRALFHAQAVTQITQKHGWALSTLKAHLLEVGIPGSFTHTWAQ